MRQNENRTALVTGAGRGIGKSIALKLAQEGYNVYVNYHRSETAAHEVIEAIRRAGGRAKPAACDVSNYDDVAQMVNRINEASDGIEILVNNAGITRDMALFRMSVDQWRQVLETNLYGTFYCVRAVAFGMMKRQRGRIINISSLSSYYGAPGQANYAASKAGIIGLTRCLATEFGPMNVTVNSVVPGLIPTEMTEKIPKDKMTRMLSKIPLGRAGDVSDIAEAVSFLAGESSRYITGQVIVVDGGLSCSLGA